MPYEPTNWQNEPSTATPLSAANLNKLTDELELQANEQAISHSLPTWANGAPPAITDAAPLNEMEDVLAEVAFSLGLSYTKTAWEAGWTPARNAARLNKMEQQAVANRAAIETPTEPTTLPFALPTLTNPIVITNVPSRYAQGNFDNDFVLPEAGRDYYIDLGRNKRHGLVISSNGRVGNVQIVNGHFECTMSNSGGVSTSFRRGGLRNNIRGAHISLTDYYVSLASSTMVDTLTCACRPDTKFTIQRSFLGAYHDLTEGFHADTLQVQGPVGRLELGLVTGFVAGDRLHAGKGLQLDIISAQGETGGPFTVELRKVDINGIGNAATGARSSMAVGKDDNASIGINFAEEVYYARAPGGFTVQDFPGWNINYPSLLQQTTTGISPNRVQTFPTTSQGWFGTVRERAFGTHFVTPASLGY